MKNPRAYRVYLLMTGVLSFAQALIFTITAIYRLQTVHVDPLQLVLVGTVLELSAFVFEVPTGVVADTFSRRLSIIIGVLLLGVSALVEGSLPVYAAVLLAQVIAGLGYTFLSGATEAWLADEVGEAHLTHAFVRAGQVDRVGQIAGIVGSVGLATISLQLPIVLGGVIIVALGGVLVLVMPETGFTPMPRGERTTWQAMGHTLREGLGAVRQQPLLANFLLLAAVLGMTSEGLDRLWEAHFLTNFTFPALGNLPPVVWFGLINLGSLALSLVALELARRLISTDAPHRLARVLALFTALRIAAIVAFGLATSFPLAVGAFWAMSVLRGVGGVFYGSWLTASIAPQVRATVLSLAGQADAISQIAVGPAIGAVGNRSLRAALVLAGVLLLPALWLYPRAARLAPTHSPSIGEQEP